MKQKGQGMYEGGIKEVVRFRKPVHDKLVRRASMCKESMSVVIAEIVDSWLAHERGRERVEERLLKGEEHATEETNDEEAEY